MKTLIFDLETAPNLSYVWGMWEQNVIDVKEHWYIMCFAYKWLGEKKIHIRSLPEYKAYKKDTQDDSELMKDLWDLFDEADVVIGHNGDAFDIKKSNARFIINGLNPPSPYKSLDTKKIAKKYFKFDSNKLDHIGEYLGVGRKMQTGGFELWTGCMNGDKKSWDKMIKYNKQDVKLLEDIYLKMRGWVDNHPNIALHDETPEVCPNCGCSNIQKRGFNVKKTRRYQRFQCQDCGKWHQSTTCIDETKPLYTN